MTLEELQRELIAYVTGVGEVPARLAAVSSGHLEVYRNGYRSRLLALLQSEYPRLATYLGGAFPAAVAQYALSRPPSHPLARELVRAFPDWLAASAAPPTALAFALLERARAEAADAPETSAAAKRFIPSLKVVRLPADAFSAFGAPSGPVDQRARAGAVWRAGFGVAHVLLEEAEAVAIERAELPADFASRWTARGWLA